MWSQKAYQLFKHGESPEILFGKLNPFTSQKIRKRTLKQFPPKEKDRYLPVNRAILKIIENINIKYKLNFNRFSENKKPKPRIILVLKKEIPRYYTELILKLNIKFIDLSQLLIEMKKNGNNPYYWKGSNKTGHWNHLAQNKIGQYLAKKIAEYLK